jgi:hypothetical protein
MRHRLRGQSICYEQRKQCNELELSYAECYTVTYMCCLFSLQVSILQQLNGVQHVPTLHGTGTIQGPDPAQTFKYIAITPVGQHLGSDCAGMILKVASHVAAVIAALENQGLIHRCVIDKDQVHVFIEISLPAALQCGSTFAASTHIN